MGRACVIHADEHCHCVHGDAPDAASPVHQHEHCAPVAADAGSHIGSAARSIHPPAYQKAVVGGVLSAVSVCVSAGSLNRLSADYQIVAAEGRGAHVFDIDNDVFLLNRNDGFYTNGLRYTRHHILADTGGITSFGWRIGQEIYTASDIKLPPEAVGPPNHPYAGWLYGGFFKENHRADGRSHRIGIDFGCLGPCSGAKQAQTSFHRLLRQPLPQAWSKQVKNEVGMVLYGEIAPVRWRLGQAVDITPSLHGRFGNIYTDAGAGVTVRAGRLNVLPDQPTFHAFINLDVKAVGYNASLQGGYFSSGNPHTVEPKRWVGTAEGGIAWTGGPYRISAALVRHGNEIRALPDSIGSQTFVRLQLSYFPG